MSRSDADPSAPREYHPLAAFLSYLVPGLGQIYQGRIFKGVLFFVCVLTLFYYGMFLGKWSNVYLADYAEHSNPLKLPKTPANLYNRPQFICQFWIGIAAWPAIVQDFTYHQDDEKGKWFGSYQRMPYESRSTLYPPEGQSAGETREERRENRAQYRRMSEDELRRVMQVVANARQVDDALAESVRRAKENLITPAVALRDWEGKTVNELQTAGDKNWDLGWVFTVIAGVLNLMVIYDALAGPAYLVVREPERELVEVS